jgi:hypothetical protein
LNVVMLSVVMLSVVMLSVVMLSVVMLNIIMLSVVWLNVIMLSVPGPKLFTQNLSSVLLRFVLVLVYFLEISVSGNWRFL